MICAAHSLAPLALVRAVLTWRAFQWKRPARGGQRDGMRRTEVLEVDASSPRAGLRILAHRSRP
jgi:hypothetical protein